MEENLDLLAVVETIDNDKPIRETINAGIPLTIDHSRYFASVIRTEAGSVTDFNVETVNQEINEPPGDGPWNFPLLTIPWKIAPAIITGETTTDRIIPAKTSFLSPWNWATSRPTSSLRSS